MDDKQIQNQDLPHLTHQMLFPPKAPANLLIPTMRASCVRMSRFFAKRSILFFICISGFLGCDSKPEIPPELANSPVVETPKSTRPTTKQLTDGKRKNIQLGSAPIMIGVPPGWKLNSIGTGVYVEGDTPNGNARIHLDTSGESFKLDYIKRSSDINQKKATSQPNFQAGAIKDLGGGAKMYEVREKAGSRFPSEADPKIMEEIIDWSVYIFVPKDGKYNLTLLHFYGLTVAQYEKDRDFLDYIVKSIHYDASAGALD